MINFFFISNLGYEPVKLFAFALAYMLAIAIAVSFHEYAHAFVAYKFGDDTVKLQGRLTLNPLKHISGMGFLMFLLFGFGWAKPVQINPLKFRNYKKGMALVSLAGIIANLILALLFFGFLILYFLFSSPVYVNMFQFFLEQFLFYSLILNITLAVFNLLPIYPLDGFNFVSVFLKDNNPYVVFMQKYGFIILLLFILTPLFEILLSLIFSGLTGIFSYITSLFL